jgi:multiple sugar transport system permease protein
MATETNTAGRRIAGTRRPRLSLARGRSLRGIGYATPTAVIVTVFFLVPLVLVFWMSVNRWPLLGTPTFNAPDNFTKIPDNQLFVDAIWFTLKYTVITTVVLSAGAMGLALMVQGRRRGVGLFRTAFFLPGAIGFAAAALLFVWRFAGFNMLILLTGLQSIPTDIYEAARVDGASRWQAFRHITLPLLRPTIALMLVLSITGSLLAFDQFFILTRGGPDNSTVSMVMVIYREAFTRFDLGSAAAISVVLLAVLVVLNTLQLRVLGRRAEKAS